VNFKIAKFRLAHRSYSKKVIPSSDDSDSEDNGRTIHKKKLSDLYESDQWEIGDGTRETDLHKKLSGRENKSEGSSTNAQASEGAESSRQKGAKDQNEEQIGDEQERISNNEYEEMSEENGDDQSFTSESTVKGKNPIFLSCNFYSRTPAIIAMVRNL
jgi:hypothetical protein